MAFNREIKIQSVYLCQLYCIIYFSLSLFIQHNILASCPLGPATARRVGILTEMHVVYIERYTSPISTLAAAGEAMTHGRKEGRKES